MPRSRSDIAFDIARNTPRGAVNANECVFCYKSPSMEIKDLIPLCSPCHSKFLLLIELQAC